MQGDLRRMVELEAPERQQQAAGLADGFPTEVCEGGLRQRRGHVATIMVGMSA